MEEKNTVEVRLFATFRENREKIVFLKINEYPTLRDILSHLKINEKEIAIILVNGRHSSADIEIHGGDVIALFPPVGGG